MKSSHRIAGLIAVAVAAVLVTWASIQIDWFPTLISPLDGKIDSVYEALLIASVPFFVVICAAIVFMIIEFRAKGDDDDRDGQPIHGSTKLEILWTLVPTLIVIGLGIYAWVVLIEIEKKQPNEIKINVIGQQFAWSFEYLDDQNKVVAKSNQLVVPKDRNLVFNVKAVDVVHSFFVPNARLKRDATPGRVKQVRFKPTVLGKYPIICAELCGIGHATMRQTMTVVPEDRFLKFFKESGGSLTALGKGKAAGAAAGAAKAKRDGDAEVGKSVFEAQGCAGCHTLAAANTSGKVGPSLDNIGSLSEDEILAAIVDPDEQIVKGYSKGIMPPDFGQKIPKEDLDALLAFLQQAGK